MKKLMTYFLVTSIMLVVMGCNTYSGPVTGPESTTVPMLLMDNNVGYWTSWENAGGRLTFGISSAITYPVKLLLSPAFLLGDYISPWNYARNTNGKLYNELAFTNKLPMIHEELLATPIYVVLSIPLSAVQYVAVKAFSVNPDTQAESPTISE